MELGQGVVHSGAVPGWDLLVAAGIGHPAVMAGVARYSAAIERVTGAVLLAIAAGGLWLLAGALLCAGSPTQ